MNYKERFRFDSFVRIDVFGKENASDFPAGSRGAALFAELITIINRLRQTGANQSAAMNDSRHSFKDKSEARETVRKLISAMARTAEAASLNVPALKDKFRLGKDMNNDQKLLAAARAFDTEAEMFETTFIEYGLSSDFLDVLDAAIQTFDATLTTTNAALGEQVASTAEIAAAVEAGMKIRTQLDVIVRNKYAGNAGKLAAWERASHIEHKKKKVEPEPVKQ